VRAAGGVIVRELPQLSTLVVTWPPAAASGRSGVARVAASPALEGLIPDRVVPLILPEGQLPTRSPQHTRTRITPPTGRPRAAVSPDPAFAFPGLLWD